VTVIRVQNIGGGISKMREYLAREKAEKGEGDLIWNGETIEIRAKTGT